MNQESTADDTVCVIECKGKQHPAPPQVGEKWSPCDYAQFCAKLKEVEKQAAQEGKLKKPLSKTRKAHRTARQTVYTKRYRRAWNSRVAGMSEAEKKDKFYHECAYNKSKNGTDVTKFQPDHIQEIQHGGHLRGPFKWCTSYVNGSLGPTLTAFKAGKHKTIQADCCTPPPNP
jgi:hypothetical protein